MSIAAIGKDSKPILLSGTLFIIAIVFLYSPMITNEASLWVDVTFFTILNIVFLVASILGVKTRNKPVALFSLLVNSALITIGMLFIILYLSIILIT